MMIKVATFNVNSIRTRLGILLPWMKEESVDCCAVQETKAQDKDFPVTEIEDAGFYVYYKGEKSYNGVAFITTFEPEKVSSGFDGAGNDQGSRLITLTYKNVLFVNTYVPQGQSPDSEKFQYKLQWFARLKEFFIQSGHENIIWCGDFNVAPEERDVHNPKKLLGNIGFHPEEHRALGDVKEFGFTDIFRKHCDDDNEFTFWDYRVRDGLNRGLGWRIDHIWATGDVAEASKNSWIDRGPRQLEKPSDHTPLLAEFDII